MQPTLLVLAAGMGSRYGGLKQMDPMGPSGETIIDYSVFDAKRAGFGRVVFVIRPDFAEAFKAQVGSRFEKVLPVDYCYQELSKLPAGFRVPEGREKPWGTGHAILMAEGLVNEPFAVINADDFYGAPAFRALADFLAAAQDPAASDYAMVGYVLRSTLTEHGTVARGVCQLDAQGRLLSVREHTKIARNGRGAHDLESGVGFTGDELVSLNFWGFTPSLFSHLRAQFAAFLTGRSADLKAEFFIPTVVDRLLSQGKATAKVLAVDSPWFGVTYREDKPRVQASIRKLVDEGVYPRELSHAGR